MSTTSLWASQFVHLIRTPMDQWDEPDFEDHLERLIDRRDPQGESELSNLFENDRVLFNRYLALENSHEDLIFMWDDKFSELDAVFSVIDGWLSESLDHLRAYQTEWGRSEASTTLEVQSVASHSSTEYVRLQVWMEDSDPRYDTLLWDELYLIAVNPFDAAWYLNGVTDLTTLKGSQAKGFSPAPLFKYHPERYRQTRSYTKLMAERKKKAAQICGDSAEHYLNYLIEPLANEFNDRSLNTVPLREKELFEFASMPNLKINTEVDRLFSWLDFDRSGRQIFDLSGPLVEMFRNTSADDVPVSLLSSPYKSYYLHFGAQAQLKCDDDWYVDGAYITHWAEDNLLNMAITFSSPDCQKVAEWTRFFEPRVTLSFTKDLFDLNIAEATDIVIERKRAEFQKKLDKGDKNITADIAEEAQKVGLMMPGAQFIQLSGTVGQLYMDRLNRETDLLAGSLNLIVNAMCYLMAYPDDIRSEWPESAPRHLVSEASKGHPAVKKNTQTKLEKMGCRKIHLCGRALHQGPVVPSGPDATRTVKTHWRRGHWKQQPYGQGNKLRKLVLIKPTLVNAGAGYDDDLPGSIYIGENVVRLRK